MTVRVVPTDNPTHHIKLSDRAGTTVGLILANAKGDPAPSYSKSPVDRTALKTSSGTAPNFMTALESIRTGIIRLS